MHLNNLTDQELKNSLGNLQKIIPSYQEQFFYNRTLVDPYLLASHGITISRKRLKPSESASCQAICSDPHCDLTFPFDSHHDIQLKEDLESVIRDHDRECAYRKIKNNLICFKMFVRLGRWIFSEHMEALSNQKTWIQLDPQEILEVVEINKVKEESEDVYGSTWSQFKLLDPSFGQPNLTKVKSAVFLAIFGWIWKDKSLLCCQFCGTVKDVAEFISPLEFSLLKMTEGFSFLGSHHSWCCLVAPLCNYWEEILRQAAIGSLKELQGGASTTWLDLECKNIQRNLLQIYTEHALRMSLMKKELDSKKSEVESKIISKKGVRGQEEQGEIEEDENPYQMIATSYEKLGQLLEEQKKSEEELILNIRTQ